jgi:hypothetical protein
MTGETNENDKDNYSVNYRLFQEKCESFAAENTLHWKKLCLTFLLNCIILPINCDSQSTALTIFSTLNDRGEKLEDSDIFKAKLYVKFDNMGERKDFIDKWKRLSSICKEAGIDIDNVFRYYMHVLRARNGIRAKEKALRDFYAEDQYKILNDDNLLNEILLLADFWVNVNSNTDFATANNYHITIRNRQLMHCLTLYPNEFWKYILSVFFLKNNHLIDFNERLEFFLKNIIAYLFVKFIEKPTVNAIKDTIFDGCISIERTSEANIKYKFDKTMISTRFSGLGDKITKAILMLEAYLNPNQNNIITDKIHVEHILPKKWLKANYQGWEKDDAESFIEKIGNKIIFEGKLNIEAGNGYFGKKKAKYAVSNIAVVKDLSRFDKEDWAKEEIMEREDYLINQVLSPFFENNLKN